MELTNRDIINFFADKSVESLGKESATQIYLKEIRESRGLKGLLNGGRNGGNYVDLAHSFKFFRMISGDGSAENMFKSCTWLKTLNDNLAKDNKLDVFLDKISPENLYEEIYEADFQKWHLIVSYYALTWFYDLTGIGKNVSDEKIKSEEDFLSRLCLAPNKVVCKELLYWMWEASAGNVKAEELREIGQEYPASEILWELKNKAIAVIREDIRKAVKAAKGNDSIEQYI